MVPSPAVNEDECVVGGDIRFISVDFTSAVIPLHTCSFILNKDESDMRGHTAQSLGQCRDDCGWIYRELVASLHRFAPGNRSLTLASSISPQS